MLINENITCYPQFRLCLSIPRFKWENLKHLPVQVRVITGKQEKQCELVHAYLSWILHVQVHVPVGLLNLSIIYMNFIFYFAEQVVEDDILCPRVIGIDTCNDITWGNVIQTYIIFNCIPSLFNSISTNCQYL